MWWVQLLSVVPKGTSFHMGSGIKPGGLQGHEDPTPSRNLESPSKRVSLPRDSPESILLHHNNSIASRSMAAIQNRSLSC